jgi:hypothetical protein
MLWWLVDNANLVLLLLVLAALVLGVGWWLTRRGAFVLGLAGVLALAVLVWVLSLLVVTDRKQLVRIVEDVAQKINTKDLAGAFRHFADEVELDINDLKVKRPRKKLEEMAEDNFKRWKIAGVVVWDVDVEKVERPDAVVRFYVRAQDQPGTYARCEAKCRLTGERDWRVTALKVEFLGGGGGRVVQPR